MWTSKVFISTGYVYQILDIEMTVHISPYAHTGTVGAYYFGNANIQESLTIQDVVC